MIAQKKHLRHLDGPHVEVLLVVVRRVPDRREPVGDEVEDAREALVHERHVIVLGEKVWNEKICVQKTYKKVFLIKKIASYLLPPL